MNGIEITGAVIVDKPAGWTSHDVVAKMRRLAQTKKVGHLGTLDPAATGVLPLLLGRATRLAQYFVTRTKEYEALIRFGFATDTYDAEGTPITEPCSTMPSHDEVVAALDTFRGPLQQVPPPVSAKKVNGVPAYKLARRHQPVELPAVAVEVSELELLDQQDASVRIRVVCSAGTYVRSIAHDLGVRLGCGAHLETLRRTRSGEFTLAQSRTLEALTLLAQEGRLQEALIPASQLLPEMPSHKIDDLTAGHVRQGREFRTSPFLPNYEAPMVKAINDADELVAIAKAQLPGLYRPVCVL